jgi:hypothetical protein
MADETNKQETIIYSSDSASLFFKCIICNNYQNAQSLYNQFTPICDKCLFDLKYYVETRRPKT